MCLSDIGRYIPIEYTIVTLTEIQNFIILRTYLSFYDSANPEQSSDLTSILQQCTVYISDSMGTTEGHLLFMFLFN